MVGALLAAARTLASVGRSRAAFSSFGLPSSRPIRAMTKSLLADRETRATRLFGRARVGAFGGAVCRITAFLLHVLLCLAEEHDHVKSSARGCRHIRPH